MSSYSWTGDIHQVETISNKFVQLRAPGTKQREVYDKKMFLHETHHVRLWYAFLKAHWCPFFFFFAEVSWVSGREEAMRVPPSETVTYQRPDHRLRPSAGTLLVTGLYPPQGGTWLDQKTPNGPKDCPAGSWSRWDTIHFTPPSVNGVEERGFVFVFSKVGWDHRLVIKCCPLTLWFSTMIIAVMSGFCSAVKWSDDTVKAKSIFFWNAKQMWSFLLNCIFILSFILSELKSVDL